ncbi:MAG: PSD1 and planctomycete cytochrome C domain-containing protein [Planctomycetaceae bacterium]
MPAALLTAGVLLIAGNHRFEVTAAEDAGEQSAEQSTETAPEISREQRAFVETKILPLLKARCFECHSDMAEEPGGSLLLTSRTAMLHGGDSGPAVQPGKPDDSLIIQAVRYEAFEMPPRTRLPEEEIDLLSRWIRDGAPWPKDLDTAAPPPATEIPLEERKRAHWAWQPIQRAETPAVEHADWPKSDVDRFVLAQMEAAGLQPTMDADRPALVRRLYFDLIGLPPTVAQVAAFVNDPASDDDAIAKLVDELLASPHFGERWGRHWLDLVRYAETLGHEFDYPLPYAWRYRDYVIRAFNADVPYDQLIREHIAGDLLPNPRRNPDQGFDESVIGTGFWFLGEDKHAPVDVKGEEAARIDNQLDVFSKAFLGLTVACARCHDHKFDPISSKDYYALSGFLQSSRRTTAWLDPDGAIGRRVEKLQAIQDDTERLTAQLLETHASAATLQNLASAAIDVVRGADPASTAAEHNCDAELLQRWVTLLKQPETRALSHPLSCLATVAQADGSAEAAPVADWRNRATSEQTSASDHTTLLADLSNGRPDGWFVTGPAFSSREGRGPIVKWTPAGPKLSAGQGVTSAELSPGLTGSLTSPTFELTAPEILIRVAGEATRVRLVIDGYVMNEFSELLFAGARKPIDTGGAFQWIRLAQDVHRYQGHRAYLEFLDEGGGWFTVREIRFANQAGAEPPAETVSDANLRLAASLADNAAGGDVIKQWAATCASQPAVQATVFNEGLVPVADDNWAQKAEQWTAAARDVPQPVPVMSMTEGTPENESLFIRGSHLNLGQPVERSFLDAISGTEQPRIEAHSGRLELCQRMLSRDNPFPARVAVNRVWHHLFGVGIVPSTDNFGVLGQAPTNPELLDYLAHRFRSDGWSVKRLIRSLVTSRTYRLSSQRSSADEQADPTNHLLHRANIRRLEGETIRDAILQMSGSLDPTLFGEPVPVHLTAFMQGRGRPAVNGPLDGNGRRSIYISINRNFLSPFMLAFDVPAPMTTIGDRGTSNVPAQALILLNNDFIAQQCDRWAARLLETGDDVDAMLNLAWQQAYSRPANPAVIGKLREFMDTQASQQSTSIDDSDGLRNALADVCHVLLNSKEFLFLN